MPINFDDPKHLISHSREEIDDVERLARAYVASRKYTPMIHVDAETREKVFTIKIEGGPLPPKIANHVKDATGNLRDALDHAVYCATVGLRGGGAPKYTGFPFADSAKGIEGELDGPRLRDNAPEIRQLLIGFQPYKGGNHTLWAL